MHRCFQLLALKHFSLVNTFESFFHFARWRTEARQLAPAITLSEAFSKSVEHLLKLHLQALEPRSQDSLGGFR